VSDNLILYNIKLRNPKAIEYLYDRYYEKLCFFAGRFVFDSDTAREIVQTVLIRIWENAGKITINGSVNNYLYICVKNESLRFLRSLKVRDTANRLWAKAHIESMHLELYDRTDPEILEQLVPFIEKLPRQCRDVFRYRAEYGYKYKEIAQLLNISENVAKVQMSRALKRVKEMFIIKSN
jgi:RNA polymerase sigma-70 factor (ECF subfamily)